MGPVELRAIEEAVEALGRHDPGLALSALAQPMESSNAIGAVFDAVVMAASELASQGDITPGTWNALADALPVELQGIVEAWRS